MKTENLQKMNRKELLELLVIQSKENDRLREQLIEVNHMLTDRRLMIEHAGSIAEASLQINKVFEAAQNAADQYIENIKIYQEQFCKSMTEEGTKKYNEQIVAAREHCQALEFETAKKCAAMIADAKQRAESIMHMAEKKSDKSKLTPTALCEKGDGIS